MGDARRPVEVLLIDDHQMFVESLARVLADDDRIDVVGIASTAAEGRRLAQRHRPRVALVDFMLPDEDGVELAAGLKAADPDLMAVMLTASTEDRVLVGAIDAGCSGFLTKDRAVTEVVDAVLAAADGEALISPSQLARLLPRLSKTTQSVGADLTRRELQLLNHLARGQSNKAIAEELHLSVNTIRNYMQSVLIKLGAHSKLEAVSTAVREGLIDYQGAR
ncbi:MAG: response regulator [Acidimicrobiales bacterium]